MVHPCPVVHMGVEGSFTGGTQGTVAALRFLGTHSREGGGQGWGSWASYILPPTSMVMG